MPIQKYITQLLQQLAVAAKDLPGTYPYEMDHPMPEGMAWVPELAKAPYKSIAAWTGVEKNAFPPVDQLNGKQIQAVVGAIATLWEAFRWDYDVREEEMPVELRYRILVDCWDDAVQYLPDSGFDIDVCEGDVGECWLGQACFCLKNPPLLDMEELPDERLDTPDDNDMPF